MPINHYKTLQVDPKADEEVIQAAYRALVKIHSKDDQQMVRLNDARSVLTSAKRVDHDEALNPKGKRIIGEYRILEKISEGGFGTTYKAEHTTLGSLVCIKHASHITPTDECILLEEAKAMWELRHYGIPAVRGLLRMSDGSLSLVMSYIPGPTLAQLLEKYPDGLDPEHVAWITERILNILRYLHMHGVVHGDLKPQNVIIQPESHTLVLVDYGLSVVKPRSITEAKGYTEYFCAPEQIEGKPPIPQTDLYGLGMTIIYALGGDVLHCRVSDAVPKGMRDFLKDLIRRNPMARPDVWTKDDLCARIIEVRQSDFGRTTSEMKKLDF